MSKPESRGPGRAPLPATRVNAFFHHLGRSTLQQLRQDDDAFAECWARALDLGVERLQDNAMPESDRFPVTTYNIGDNQRQEGLRS